MRGGEGERVGGWRLLQEEAMVRGERVGLGVCGWGVMMGGWRKGGRRSG